MKLRKFDPARNDVDRRWLERVLGYPAGSLKDKPVGELPDTPFVQFIRALKEPKP